MHSRERAHIQFSTGGVDKIEFRPPRVAWEMHPSSFQCNGFQFTVNGLQFIS